MVGFSYLRPSVACFACTIRVLPLAIMRVKCPSAVAENQPVKNRMNRELSSFASRLGDTFLVASRKGGAAGDFSLRSSRGISDRQFSEFALELFVLQFRNNPAYQQFCLARRVTPQSAELGRKIIHLMMILIIYFPLPPPIC
jgi:hypothetical protein